MTFCVCLTYVRGMELEDFLSFFFLLLLLLLLLPRMFHIKLYRSRLLLVLFHFVLTLTIASFFTIPFCLLYFLHSYCGQQFFVVSLLEYCYSCCCCCCSYLTNTITTREIRQKWHFDQATEWKRSLNCNNKYTYGSDTK